LGKELIGKRAVLNWEFKKDCGEASELSEYFGGLCTIKDFDAYGIGGSPYNYSVTIKGGKHHGSIYVNLNELDVLEDDDPILSCRVGDDSSDGVIQVIDYLNRKVQVITRGGEFRMIDVSKDVSKNVQNENKASVETAKDNVNHPVHYNTGRVEVIDIIEDAVQGASPFEAVCVANVLKYVLRYRYKNGVEDLKKTEWYMKKLIREVEKQHESSELSKQS